MKSPLCYIKIQVMFDLAHKKTLKHWEAWYWLPFSSNILLLVKWLSLFNASAFVVWDPTRRTAHNIVMKDAFTNNFNFAFPEWIWYWYGLIQKCGMKEMLFMLKDFLNTQMIMSLVFCKFCETVRSDCEKINTFF